MQHLPGRVEDPPLEEEPALISLRDEAAFLDFHGRELGLERVAPAWRNEHDVVAVAVDELARLGQAGARDA